MDPKQQRELVGAAVLIKLVVLVLAVASIAYVAYAGASSQNRADQQFQQQADGR